MPPTDKQQATLDYCRAFLRRNQQLPPHRVIARHFGILQTAARHRLLALEKKGHLRRNELGNIMISDEAPVSYELNHEA